MRRRLIILAVALAAAFAALAQLASTSRAMLSASLARPAASRAEAEDEPEPYIPLIIMSEDDQALQELGVIVWHRRAGMLLASVPRESIDGVLALPGVICAEASLRANACMDIARPLCGVDRIQAGAGLPEAYRGRGMLVGFADIGFDANHIAFAGRVKGFYYYDAARARRVALTDPQEIAAYATDSAQMWHATHVANILAGGYMGNGYYGVAPEADIAAATSPLDDVSILCGLEEIIALGRSRGQRPVINMSLSTNIGPHDGTDLLCRYLTACADEAMLCVSAGNRGTRSISASHRFEADGERRVCVNNSATWDGFKVDGITEFWGADASAFEMRVEVYDKDARQLVFASPWVQDGELEVSAEAFPEWELYMQGRAYAAACVSPLNGRYSATAVYDVATEAVSAAGPWSRYCVSLAVRCRAGQQIDVFADAQRSFLGTVPPYDSFSPNADMSISDMATAAGVMSVGMCGSRATAPGGFEWPIDVHAMNPYSSYGLGLPTIAAPGWYIVSAISGVYMAEHPDAPYSAEAVVDGRHYWWTPDCGTSMSAPYAAGAMALWLQANPGLTNDQLIGIAKATAVPGEADPSNPRWGAGRLDAYAGLRQAIDMAGMSPADQMPLVKVNPDRTLEISASARIYTCDGRLVAAGLKAGPLSPGIYIVSTPAATAKVAVRGR